jgi:plastocyanin
MRRILGWAVVCGLALAALAVVSCTKKTTPMSPAPINAPLELNGSLSTTSSQYMHTFTTAGAFNYECTVHPSCASLMGTIVVVADSIPIATAHHDQSITLDGGSSGPYGSTCSALSVQLDSVHVGEQVTWTNNSTLPHTVVSH